MDNFEILYRSGMMSKQNINGTPPLTFTSNGSPLVDYTIYGADEGVGDRTKNLADINSTRRGFYAYADGHYGSDYSWLCTYPIECSPNTAYTFSFKNMSRWYGFVWFDAELNYVSTNNLNVNKSDVTYTATSPINAAFMVVNIGSKISASYEIKRTDMVDFQLEEGDTVTSYEPYGYKIPITCGGVTTNIYLDSPLYEGDSISFSAAGVEIPTIEGENTLTVGTTIQPSAVEIKAVKSAALNKADRYFQYLYDVARNRR